MGRLAFALIAVVLVGGVAGCTDDADGETPKPVPSTTTTTSASPTPTDPTAPPLPDNAKGHTAKAAANFVEHYIELMNYSASTGDTMAMRAASRKCVGCMNYIKLYEKTYAKGGFFENPKWRAKILVAERERSHYAVLLDVDAPDSKYKLKSGHKVKVGKGGHYELRFWVVPHGRSWRVTLLAERGDFS